MHAKRKTTVCSHKHSFTPYPSLSHYRWTEWQRSNTLAARVLEELFFQLCCCVSFWFWREIGFELVMMDRLFLRTAGYLRFGGNWHYIIFLRIVLEYIFFRLKIFLVLVLGTNGCTTICTKCPIYAKSSNFYVKLNVANLNVTN